MSFNSIDFAVFFPLVFILYWFVFNWNLKLQNAFLILASYFFYGWWDYRFLGLIIISTLVDYLVGLGLSQQQSKSKRKVLLWTSIIVNLGFLGFFKYYNFFLENFTEAFLFFGTEIRASSLRIILPVGISFYTFQTLSYSIDVYRRKFEPTKDFISFAAFVSFFPQLVAGPIERATNLLPQFFSKRSFDRQTATDGMRQILWGLFKKVVIADNAAHFANLIFDNSSEYSGSTLALGAVFFAFQIYGDFSGYSDIAIGTSRLFGFDLMRNFAYPYFSRDIAEFWRRWHISLSTWFRDYLYIPLGGSKGNAWMKVRNVAAIFLISGFWHGANWTFIAWGALNAIYFLPLLLLSKNREYLGPVAQGRYFPSSKELGGIALTFSLTCFAWIFFRAESISHATTYIERMIIGLTNISSYKETLNFIISYTGLARLFIIIGFLVIEWIGRDQPYAIANLGLNWPKPLRWGFYYGLVVFYFIYGGNEQQFIYFQF